MIPFISHSGKGKKKKKNGREEKGSVVVGGWYEGRMAAEGHREYLESEEVFLIMVVEVVMCGSISLLKLTELCDLGLH